MTRIFVSEVIGKGINEPIHLSGWVQRRRDLGGLIFIDLRDRSGTIQMFLILKYPKSEYRGRCPQ